MLATGLAVSVGFLARSGGATTTLTPVARAASSDTAAPDLTFGVQGPVNGNGGDVVSFTFTVRDVGAGDVSDGFHFVVDFSSAGLTKLSISDPNCTYGAAGNNHVLLGCDYYTIGPGQSVAVTMTFRVDDLVEIFINGQVRLTGGVPDADPSNDAFSFDFNHQVPNSPTAILNKSNPSVSGVATVGGVLTGDPGMWGPPWPYSYQYIWYRQGPAGASPIAGVPTSATSYTVSQYDAGCTILLKVIASAGSVSSDPAFSSPTAAVPGGPCDISAGPPPTSTTPTTPTTSSFSFVSTLPHATASMHYSFATVTGDISPSSVTVVAGALPSGMNVSSSGVLEGAPYQSGRYTFTLEAKDAFSNHPPIRGNFTLIVDPNQDFVTAVPGPSAKVVGKTVLLAKRTKQSGCKRGALPDRRCSPGAYYSKLTKKVLCAPSFRTAKVGYVPDSEKHQVEVEYGMTPKSYGRTVEIDQIVPLELGGSNDIANLYPEPGAGPASYRVKDKLENKLHNLVCAGSMSLHAAQAGIARNWETLDKTVFGVAP